MEIYLIHRVDADADGGWAPAVVAAFETLATAQAYVETYNAANPPQWNGRCYVGDQLRVGKAIPLNPSLG